MTNVKLHYIEIDNPELKVVYGDKPDIEHLQNAITGRAYDQTEMWAGLLPYYSWRRNPLTDVNGQYDKVNLRSVHFNIQMYEHRKSLYMNEYNAYEIKKAEYEAAITKWPIRKSVLNAYDMWTTNWNERIIIPERPCPPKYIGDYIGFRLKPTDLSQQNIDQDVDASEAIDKVGYGWNTVGELLHSPSTGKNYGVFGQGNGMPDTTAAASKNSKTSLFPRGLLLTVYGVQRGQNPSGSLSLTVGAYAWDETLTLAPPAPAPTATDPGIR